MTAKSWEILFLYYAIKITLRQEKKKRNFFALDKNFEE